MFEVLVVDDGGASPAGTVVEAVDSRFTVIRLAGVGPARARNAGAAASEGDVLLFTDDDTEPAPGWVAAAWSFLEADREALGVEGPVVTPPWDPLHEYSVWSAEPGAYLTCNVAYRRGVFVDESGFFEGFPWASCEDHDLAFRVLRRGRIGFADDMEVVHHPRRQSLRQIARRGRLAESDAILFARHADRFGVQPSRNWLRSTWYVLAFWGRFARSSEAEVRRPRRAARLIATATAQTGWTALGSARGLRATRQSRGATARS